MVERYPVAVVLFGGPKNYEDEGRQSPSTGMQMLGVWHTRHVDGTIMDAYR